MDAAELRILTVTEYNLIVNKDPAGCYDRATRENLYSIIRKLGSNPQFLATLETRLFEKFRNAQFQALKEKDRRVRLEVARYRLSSRVKHSIKVTAMGLGMMLLTGYLVYGWVLNADTRRQVDVAWYAGLNRMGLVSREELARIQKDLSITESNLEKTRREYLELARTVELMTLNNKVTENLKYILKQIHQDPRTRYQKKQGEVVLKFADKELARYKADPDQWYLLGVIETGLLRVYYNNEQILEIEAIFGREGEETPVGEYKIKNKVYKPTWYKKETVKGRVRVRAIPFGDPEHEIGHWWLGMAKLGPKIPGSYGIHGVNIAKYNEFFKKNFDWRNGSAGCPNVQEWYLEFLGRVVPIGTVVNIVAEDKWVQPGLPGPRRVSTL